MEENLNKNISAGMFLKKDASVSFECGLMKTVSGVVLLVTDEYALIDTGKEVRGDADFCRRQLGKQRNLTTEELDLVFLHKSKINESCRALNWPEWDSWYWGDALESETDADGRPTQSVDLCFGGHGTPHHSFDRQGKPLIDRAKVRMIKVLYF